MMRVKINKASILVLGLAAIMMGSTCSFAATTFYDGFSALPDSQWTGIPSGATIEDGSLVLNNLSTAMTTTDTFKYGTYSVRFNVLGLNWGSYVYFGFCTRDPWVKDVAWAYLDGAGGTINFQARNDFGPVGTTVSTGVGALGEWHTLQIDWTVENVSLNYDGNLIGSYAGVYVPQNATNLILDMTPISTNLKIDEVRVNTAAVPEPSSLLSLLALSIPIAGGSLRSIRRRK